MFRSPLLRLLLSAVFTLWAVTAQAQARQLEWRSVDITVRLDADGALHVNERLDMIFTGDWNGPERRFRVGPDQWMRFESLARVESDGNEVSLVELNQGYVDEYRYLPEEHLLRWRSRRQSDPIFDHTELVYRINYVISGALRLEADGSYGLAHDFGFERTSAIEHLRVRLNLDDGWSTSWPSPIEIEQEHVHPGQSTVLSLSLQYSGVEPPALVYRPKPPPPPEPPLLSRLWGDGRIFASAVFLTLIAVLLEVVLSKGRKVGHLDPMPRPEEIDRAWIEEHILTLKAEVVGIAYDRITAAPEVAALLARLEQEGKVASTVTPPQDGAGPGQFELELRVPRDSLGGYERVLIDKLFVAGDRASQALLRQHYASFDPSEVLVRPLQDELGRLLGARAGYDEWHSLFSPVLALVAGLAVYSSSVELMADESANSSRTVLKVVIAVGVIISLLIGTYVATAFSDLASSLKDANVLRARLMALGLLALCPLLVPSYVAPFDLIRHVVSGLLMMGLFAWTAWPRDHAAGVLLRKRIAAVRLYFQAQLQKERPDLDDRWLPYLIALGLNREMDAWFEIIDGRRMGAEKKRRSSGSTRRVEPDSGSSDSSKDANEPRAWTGGGGGAFGGAGASGTWGSAVSSLAYTADPSSATSSSSSRSNGSHSSTASNGSGPSFSSDTKSRSGGGSAGGW